MGTGYKNNNLQRAKVSRNDEFYTQLTDIEHELKHYVEHFRGKVIYCNCDDPGQSNFWRYFHLNYTYFGLKKLIATHYRVEGGAYTMEYTGENDLNIYEGKVRNLKGTGDFRDEECIAVLKQADIICTNPPFSLFREYLGQLMEYDKQFVIIGNMNSLTYKEVFPLLKDNKIWLGNKTGDMSFRVPDNSEPRRTRYWQDESGQKWRSMGNICWFTNLDHSKRHEPLELVEHYRTDKYPKYDNYNAINVDRVYDIPMDYEGVMGVPITFMDKYCPEQFKLIGLDRYTVPKEHLVGGRVAIKGKPCYARILIKRK